MAKVNEIGRTEIAEALEKEQGIAADQTVGVLKHFISPVIGSLCSQYDAGIETPRVELKGVGVFKMRVLKAETKKIRNPKTGETFEKDYPDRCEVKFYVSDVVEAAANAVLNIG